MYSVEEEKGKEDGRLCRIGGGLAGRGGGSRVFGGGSGESEGSQRKAEPEGARKVGGLKRGERTGPTGLENSPLFLLTLARCLIASYFRIFRVELSIETRERGFVCVLSPTALVVYSPASISFALFLPLPTPAHTRPVPLLVFAPLIQLTHINPYSQKAWNVLPWTVHPPHRGLFKTVRI